MRQKAVYIATLLIVLYGFSLQSTFAAPSVSHQHNGRTHTHSLPKTGLKHYHKHMHNGRAHIHPYSAKIGFKHSHNKSARAKAWANAIKHQHGGRYHSHPLPRSGIKHQHKHRHGGRTHIHPLPVNGAKHFHQMNKRNTHPVAKTTSNPRMITGLSIKQQMAAVLGKPYRDSPNTSVTKPKASTLKPPKKINLRDKKYAALINKNTSTKLQSKTPIFNQRTINKVLASKPPPKKIVNNKKSNKPQAVRQKPASRKVVKRVIPKPIPKTVKQTLQQITESNRQFSLALRYENGTGVPKNLPQAVNWYLRAAKQGNAKAQFNLASLYENGEGVKRNIPQAIHWYTAAANNGDVNAQVSLGNRYAEGNHVPKNINEAAKWYKRAADQGDLRGRANLNYLIEDNNGVIKR